MKTNDVLYFFSDDYYSQLGENKQGKFYKRRFYNLLEKIGNFPLKSQKNILKKKLEEWRGVNK